MWSFQEGRQKSLEVSLSSKATILESMNPKEELRSALLQLRKAAAAQLARRDRLASELEALEALQEDQAAEGGDGELEARIEATREALETAVMDFEKSRAMLQDAPRLESELDRAVLLRQVHELGTSDPFEPTAVEVALGHVRDAAAEMEAELRLTREMDGPSPEVAPKPDPEARARAELARLKAEREEKKKAKKRTL